MSPRQAPTVHSRVQRPEQAVTQSLTQKSGARHPGGVGRRVWYGPNRRPARLVLGNGRWGPDDLAKELECSTRTVFRDIETLAAAGIPVWFDESIQAYCVRPDFRFSKLNPMTVDPCDTASPAVHDLLVHARRMLKESGAFLEALRNLCDRLETTDRSFAQKKIALLQKSEAAQAKSIRTGGNADTTPVVPAALDWHIRKARRNGHAVPRLSARSC